MDRKISEPAYDGEADLETGPEVFEVFPGETCL